MIEFTAFYLLTKDDFCLEESMASLHAQGVRKFFMCIPNRYWDGTPVFPEDLNAIHKITKKYKARIFRLQLNIMGLHNNNGADIEACVRNKCLSHMSFTGFSPHTLIVDADEIWTPKSLVKLRAALEKDASVEAATVKSLSVIGLPGYPVDSSQEGLLVYINAEKVLFEHGRSIDKEAKKIFEDRVSVIHFTATRKTMEEVIDKNLKSCHYKDEDYDFDGWIKDVLPNIKPGLENCHMFKHWQIWDKVRHFTSAEWSLIPKRLHQYLGRPE